MRKCFTAERFLLFPPCYNPRNLHVPRRWNSSIKPVPSSDEGLLDLLDRVEQDITGRKDPRRKESGNVEDSFPDESIQGHSSMPDLPLSPLMDPKLVAARQCYRTPKPKPTGEASELERKLAKCPYAQTLVTPIRHCQLTGARLPSHFLLNFGVMKHPTTGAQWHLPKLAIDPVFTSKEGETPTETTYDVEKEDETPEIISTVDECLENGETRIGIPEKVPTQTQFTKTKALNEPIKQKTTKLPLSDPLAKKKTVLEELEAAEAFLANPSRRTSSGSHLICSQPAMRLVSRLVFNPKNKQRTKLIPHVWKEDSWLQPEKLVWRQDMNTFVLELLRKKVFILLSILASKRGSYITRCAGYSSVSAHHQVAAVLWLGASAPDNTTEDSEQPASPETSTPQEGISSDAPSAPPPPETESTGHPITPQAASPEGVNPPLYAMIVYKSHYIPIYNLPILLGPEYVARLQARLQARLPYFQGNMAVIKSRPHALKVQMELWKLMGYMALDETLAIAEVGDQDGLRSGKGADRGAEGGGERGSRGRKKGGGGEVGEGKGTMEEEENKKQDRKKRDT